MTAAHLAMQEGVEIERLTPPVSDADIGGLAEVLADAVASGTIAHIARDAKGVVGTVQRLPAWAPNQPHRADIAKLIVHRGGRRKGIDKALMQAVEREAGAVGFRLLVLDSKRGDAGEQLYRALGWTVAGTIPRYALDTDGVTPHDTVVFYKELPAGGPAWIVNG